MVHVDGGMTRAVAAQNLRARRSALHIKMTGFVRRTLCVRSDEARIDMSSALTTVLPLFHRVRFEIHFFNAHRIRESKLVVDQRSLGIRVLQFIFDARLGVARLLRDE